MDHLEFSQRGIRRREFAFTLKYVNFNDRLIVCNARERHRLGGGNGGIAIEKLSKQAAVSFDTQRQGNDVQQHDVFAFSLEHATLNCGPDGTDFIRIDFQTRKLAEDLFHTLTDKRGSSLPPDQDHLIDVFGFELCIPQRLLAGFNSAFHEVNHHLLKLGARQQLVEVLGAGAIRRDERKVNVRLHRGRESALGSLRSFFQPLQRQFIGAQVYTILLLKLPDDPIEDFLVEGFSTQEAVAAGRQHLENTVVQFENRDVKSASAKIVNNNLLVVMLAQPVS